MHRTRIKFCGITRVEDAVAAAELGVDAVGMVLHANSLRRIGVELARRILDALPPFVTAVGLFVDAPEQTLLKIADDLGLRHLQLHGQETPAMVAALKGRAVIKALKVCGNTLGDDLKTWRGAANLHALLLDSGGGSGLVNDWQAIRTCRDRGEFAGLPPIIVAGGLRPDNVAEVVRLLRPWAVDVSSGIESSPGVKSRQKMAAFVEAVRTADARNDQASMTSNSPMTQGSA